MKQGTNWIMLRGSAFVFAIALGCSAMADTTTEADESAQVLADQVCSVCHGPGGHSADSSYPNLAAQPRAYLLGKIKLFRSRSLMKQTEGHVDVLGLSLIDDETAAALARYFSRQPPAEPVTSDATLVAAGNKIFM